MQFILASHSPRRKHLLEKMGYHFEVYPYHFQENYPSKIKVKKIPKIIAENKNNAIRNEIKKGIVLTADTLVIHNDTLLGKPKNQEEAKDFLLRLSQSHHEVTTGVCIANENKKISFSTTTTVFFNKISSSEIASYLHFFSPYDKAGSYGIQDWIGMIGIKKIKGCYYNVVGLPTSKIYECLKTKFSILPLNNNKNL